MVVPDSRSSEVPLSNLDSEQTGKRISFDDLGTVTGSEHLARYLFAAQWAPGQRAADYCCGTGYGANILAAAGAHPVYAVDVSAIAIEAAKQRYSANPTIKFFCHDVCDQLPIPEVDIAVCFEGIEHVEKPDCLLTNIRSRITPETGIAFISTPNADVSPGGHSGNPYHLREYTLKAFTELLSKHFHSVTMFFQWCFGDPYDHGWTPTAVIKALLPVSIKHRFSFRRR